MASYSITQMHLSRGISTWYGVFRDGPKRITKSLDTENRAEAEVWLRKMEAQKYLPAEHQENPFFAWKKKTASETTGETTERLLIRYRSELAAIHRAHPKTMLAYDHRLAHVDSLLKINPHITVASARAWVSKLAETMAPKTVREVVRLGKRFWAWGHAVGAFTGDDPFHRIQLPKRVRIERPFWIVDEVEAILSAAPGDELRAFWGVMAWAGLRHAEAATLTWGQLDLKKRVMRILGKGEKPATVPISSRLLPLLQALPAATRGPCFPSLTPHPSNRRRELTRACSGMEFAVDGPITLHRFRHSFASNLLRAGVSIKAVQTLMRHEDPRITLDTYGHLVQSDLHGALEML